MSQAEQVRSHEQKLVELQNKIDDRYRQIGEAVDVNAEVLKMVVVAMNLLMKKTGISNEDFAKALLDASTKPSQSDPIQSAGTGTAGSNSGIEQPTLSDGAVAGIDSGSGTRVSEPGQAAGQAEASNPVAGDGSAPNAT